VTDKNQEAHNVILIREGPDSLHESAENSRPARTVAKPLKLLEDARSPSYREKAKPDDRCMDIIQTIG